MSTHIPSCSLVKPTAFEQNRLSRQYPYVAQDAEQPWFVGVHSGIGDGYRETESQLAKLPLIWMVQEAENCGIQFRQQPVEQMRMHISQLILQWTDVDLYRWIVSLV